MKETNKQQFSQSDSSPKPRVLRFTFGPSFRGCSEEESKDQLLSSLRDQLTTSLSCVLSEDCVVKEVSCDAGAAATVVSVKVGSIALQSIEKQRNILETAANFLKSRPLNFSLTPSLVSGKVANLIVDYYLHQ